MSVGFLGMLVAAFLVVGVAGHTAQKQLTAKASSSVSGEYAGGNARE
jgi:hypothetical protein